MQKRSFRVERDFGLIVGGVFTLLSAWWLYRGKFTNIAQVTLTLGVVLMFLGLIFPRSLVYPNRAWMLLAEALSFISTRIILGLVFFLVVTPIGVVKRLSGWDPLHRRAGSSPSYWKPYSERQRDPRHYEKMF
ncbi:MAG: SxtJ family membrane protein [Pyrinomonadaceae bacterium]